MEGNLNKGDYFSSIVQDEESLSLGIALFNRMIPECHLGRDFTLDTRLIYAENRLSKTVQTDLVFENIIIEKKRDKSDKDCYVGGTRFKKGAYILAGFPTERYNWIMKNAAKVYHSSLTCPEMYSSQNYSWVPVYELPELTQKEFVDCQVYKKDLKKTVPIGAVSKVLDIFKSNLMGYGQFTVLITCYGTVNFFLTGFQLIDTTTKQRFPHPEFEASPSDAVTEKLKKLSIQK